MTDVQRESTPTLPELPCWQAVLFDGYSTGFADTVQTMFRLAIEPSCAAIAAELAAAPRDGTGTAINHWERLRTAQMELHRSFALALGGLWERNFRKHLWHSAAVLLEADRTRSLAKIEKASWKELNIAFEQVRGFPLSWFPMHAELQLLYHLTSAGRHGDGTSARTLYEMDANLFLKEEVTTGWFSWLTLGGDPPSSINRLDISLERLVVFKDAIVDFWLLVRTLQKSSAI